MEPASGETEDGNNKSLAVRSILKKSSNRRPPNISIPGQNKYPETVLQLSNMINEARRGSLPSTEDDTESENEKFEGKGKTGKRVVVPANIDTTPPSSESSSDYSSPVGSPTAPSISCGQHCCGSLFVRCAQHGRSQLLQTFTDPDSFLSKQTFSNNRPVRCSDEIPQRSNSCHNVFQKPSRNGFEDLSAKRERFKSYKKCQANKDSGRFSFHKKSIGENGGGKVPKIGLLNQDAQIKPLRSLIVRRHNSLPNNRFNEQTLTRLKNIFKNTVFDPELLKREKQAADGVAKDERCEEHGRARSNSESTIKKFSDEKIAKRIADNSGESFRERENNCGEKDVFKDCDRQKSYLILDSSSEEEDLEDETETEIEDQGINDDQVTYQRFSMGNGVMCRGSTNQVIDGMVNGTTAKTNHFYEDVEYLRSVIPRLRREAKEWENKADMLETEVLSLRRELKKRDQENIKLQREIHKLRSVLQQTTNFKQEGDLLSSLQDSHGMPGQTQQVLVASNPNKKQGVSGESSDLGRNLDQIQIQRHDKDFRSKQLIKDAVMDNDFLKNLDSSQVREIVDSVYSKEFPRGSYVLREGEAGSHLFVSAEGELEVIKDDKMLGIMGPGKAFGELAILYNCRRTASIRVLSDAKVWVLDRRVFQQIMMRTGLQRLQENINFLRSVPLLHNLSNDVLAKIADVLEVEFYPSGAHIIRQGASGDTFFIISAGSVKVTQRLPGRREDDEIRILSKGDYFGEQALLKEDCRTANVIALSPGVECLTLDRDSFIQLIGDLSELHEKDYGDQVRGLSRPSSAANLLDEEEYDYIRLDDLDVIATLGVGGFGRVELVQYMYDRSLTFALKCLKKQHIVDTQQQEHVYSEKNIMMSCNSPFICRLYRTFRDSKYVYMLLEACLGGEVWTILRDRGCFDDSTTQFVTSCVVEAFEYLHARGIIYRDLKPENLLLDTIGYVKIVDFGFSKRLGFSSKTWTFCGTPEYVAPEIILNRGHDRAVDYWSLGVLMHELLTGTPPFTATDPMKTYNIILKGIDMIDFPKHMTRAAQSLIKRLCRDSPSERLGYQRGGIQDIKKHKWFQGFDWDGLKQRALIAPFTPQVRGPTDTANFDSYPKELDMPPDEFSNWDADF